MSVCAPDKAVAKITVTVPSGTFTVVHHDNADQAETDAADRQVRADGYGVTATYNAEGV